MSYLRFDKTLMVNLQESLPREILRTNKSVSTLQTCKVPSAVLHKWSDFR